jgi:hypothetical protein
VKDEQREEERGGGIRGVRDEDVMMKIKKRKMRRRAGSVG